MDFAKGLIASTSAEDGDDIDINKVTILWARHLYSYIFIYSKDVRLPVQLQRAMAAEAEAAREARAKVILKYKPKTFSGMQEKKMNSPGWSGASEREREVAAGTHGKQCFHSFMASLDNSGKTKRSVLKCNKERLFLLSCSSSLWARMKSKRVIKFANFLAFLLLLFTILLR